MLSVFSAGRAFLLLPAVTTLAFETPEPNQMNGVPVVDLGYIKYGGLTNDTSGITYFRGIQFAASPTGDRRWQNPVPIEQDNHFLQDTIYSAEKSGPQCLQYNNPQWPDPPYPTSEDCLYLDILVPSRPASSSLPVAFQIHGGGYISGNAPEISGEAVVNASNGNLIFVTIQYRLAVLGFLGGSAIADDGVLNAGLLDQRAAMDWVQRNIRQFGGDPTRVTIWGGSAGGGSVSLQMIANGAVDTPPFAAAMVDYPVWWSMPTLKQQDDVYIYALALSGCSTLSCLRSLSEHEMTHVNNEVTKAFYFLNQNPGALFIGPVIDGTFIRDLPSVQWSQGQFYDVPIMLDRDGYEGLDFTNTSQNTQVAETAAARVLFPYAGDAFFSRLYQLYPASNFNSTIFQRQQWYGDFALNCPTYQMAIAAVDNNKNSSSVFKFVFDAGSQMHGASYDFIISADTQFWPAANNQTLAQIMTSYMVSFVVTHDPNVMRVTDAPFWPSYRGGGKGGVADGEEVGFRTLDVTYSSIVPITDPDTSPQCDFWSGSRFVAKN